jgi:membrane protease YdiL (CAAX protease family)
MNFRSGEYRAVLFWLLLLGSWQFMASPGNKNGIIGALGAAAFLVYAWANVDRLKGLGLGHASWRSTPRTNWVLAGTSGILAGITVFVIGTASKQNMRLSDDWKLVALQVTLVPVLEEVVFRGYLFAFLMWLLTRVATDADRNRFVVVLAAVAFAVVHLAQPGVSWLQLACITSTGTLYGWIRCHSGSTAPAAVSHAVYIQSGALCDQWWRATRREDLALAMNRLLSLYVDSITRRSLAPACQEQFGRQLSHHPRRYCHSRTNPVTLCPRAGPRGTTKWRTPPVAPSTKAFTNSPRWDGLFSQRALYHLWRALLLKPIRGGSKHDIERECGDGCG